MEELETLRKKLDDKEKELEDLYLEYKEYNIDLNKRIK